MQANNSCNLLCLFSWYFSHPLPPESTQQKNHVFHPFFASPSCVWLLFPSSPPKKPKMTLKWRFKLRHPGVIFHAETPHGFVVPSAHALAKSPRPKGPSPICSRASIKPPWRRSQEMRSTCHHRSPGWGWRKCPKTGNFVNLKALEVLKDVSHESNWIKQPACVQLR